MKKLSKKIKNIIFDLGDVLVNLHKKRTIDCFDGAEVSTFYNSKLNPDFINLAHQFERGEISPTQFREKLSAIFKIVFSAEKFDKCWNAMIGTMSKNRIKMLYNLRKKYRLFVLSNTNEIHCEFFSKEDYWDNKIFETVYFSNELKMRKPEPRIFEYVLTENNLIPEETLFLDDNAENIASAEKLGIISVVVDSEVEEILRKMEFYK